MVCQKHTEDVVLHQTGLLKLSPGCNGYTSEYHLATTSEIQKNVTHFVPQMNILNSKEVVNFEEKPPIYFKPVRLTNVDLNELTHASNKLQEMDRVLGIQLSHPIFKKNISWFYVVLIIILNIIVVILVIKYLDSIKRLFKCCLCVRDKQVPGSGSSGKDRIIVFNANQPATSMDSRRELVPFVTTPNVDEERVSFKRTPF